MGCGASNEPAGDEGVADFKGEVFRRGEAHYEDKRYQYGTSSYPKDQMSPSAILYATCDDDVIAAIKYAEKKGVAAAVRSGGHQYSGKSSTGGDNVQVDMSHEHWTKMEYPFGADKSKKLLKIGVGAKLKDIGSFMGKERLFVPHGACAYVAAGGHCQTGGYSAIPRAFGLFSDHIQRIRIITADCKIREIWRDTNDKDDAEIFWSTIGGSPGNFGIITDVVIKPRHDEDHPNARAFSGLYEMNDQLLRNLTETFAELNDRCDEWDRDYDFTFLPFGQDHLNGLYGGCLKRNIDEKHDGWLWVLGEMLISRPATILVLAHWGNTGGKDQEYDPNNEFMAKVKKACDVPGVSKWWIFPGNFDDSKPRPISETLTDWTLLTKREFDLPFVKRNFATKSRSLSTSGWRDWFVERVTEVCPQQGKDPKYPRIHLSAQVAMLGGKHSKFAHPDDAKISCTWRDSTVDLVLDAFYETSHGNQPLLDAKEWGKKCTDGATNGGSGGYSDEDRRLLWASFGNPSLDDMHKSYYAPDGTYDRLLANKKKFDPNNRFTPNLFCVGANAIYDTKTGELLDKKADASKTKDANKKSTASAAAKYKERDDDAVTECDKCDTQHGNDQIEELKKLREIAKKCDALKEEAKKKAPPMGEAKADDEEDPKRDAEAAADAENKAAEDAKENGANKDNGDRAKDDAERPEEESKKADEEENRPSEE